MSEKTIAAISTPSAPGGIGIIRISGDRALEIASKVFIPVNRCSLTESPGYKAYYGSFVYNGEKTDDGICLVFRAPHSYTGEDVAELNCHGGLYITKQILRSVLDAGAEAAGPGEFTKRAFLNGKMDLAESESVMALISASGKSAAAAALGTLEGRLSNEIHNCCAEITRISATLSAWIDYPDDEIEELENSEILTTFSSVKQRLEKIVNQYDNGKALTEGIDTVIIGRPNVGKSTIMNMLAGYDRSIVTDIAGTTRDVVEEKISVGDIILNIADTAGIHNTDDIVEHLGIDLARKRLARADLVIAVFDGSREINDDDVQIVTSCSDKIKIALINKSDLPHNFNHELIDGKFDSVIEISAKTGEGKDELINEFNKLLHSNEFDPGAACLTGERQRSCCIKAINHLNEAIEALNNGVTLDAVNVCADCAIDAMLELTGEKAAETIVNDIFSRFCVGK